MSNFIQYIKNLAPARVASLAVIVVFLISFIVYLGTRVGASDYSILYTDLDLEDAKQIVNQLEQNNVSYKLEKNGTQILVPSKDVNKMRIDTAELAMSSKGSNVGYELFDNTDALGSTNFVQNVNLIRALEGELARTIRSMDNIKSARVHLVLPKREMFSKEEQQPSASVVIRTKEGDLSIHSVQSIQKLISAAVPKLSTKNIAIVDGHGNLLTTDEEQEKMMLTANNDLLKSEQEKKLAQDIQFLLERTVGEDKVRAKVSMDINFDQEVTNEEIYDPDSQVVRSQASVTDDSTSTGDAVPVSVSQNIPNGQEVTTDSTGLTQSSRTEETVNYEISKIIRNKVKQSGTLTRLSVAVLVDGVYEKNEQGEVVYRDRSAQELEKITLLVKSAVGFDADRGDSVEVATMRFVGEEDLLVEEAEVLIFGFKKSEIIKMAEGLGVAIVAVLIILLVIRPLINNAFEGGSGVNEGKLISDASEEENMLLSNFLNDEDSSAEDLININKIEGRVKVSSLKKLNELVGKDPETTVNIIRSWLYRNDNQ